MIESTVAESTEMITQTVQESPDLVFPLLVFILFFIIIMCVLGGRR